MIGMVRIAQKEIVLPLPYLSNYLLFSNLYNFPFLVRIAEMGNSSTISPFSLLSIPVFIIVVSWIKETGAALRHLAQKGP